MAFGPGKIEVLEFQLINNYGTSSEFRADIHTSVETFTLYENVFFEYMFGVVKVLDANELYNTLPITTDTYVYIKLRCPLTGKTVKMMYKIYKISNVNQESPKLQSYIIQFVSVEMFNSMRKRISKCVKGDLIKEIEELHNSYSSKKLEYDSYKGKSELIIPFFTASDTIKFIVKNLKWKGIIPDYCYWENMFNFNCKSLSACSIYGAVHDIVSTEIYDAGNMNGFTFNDFSSISDIYQPQNFDSLQKLYSGYSGSTVFLYDPINGSENGETIGSEPLSKAFVYTDSNIDYISFSKRDQLLRDISEKYFYVRVPGLLERTSGDIANLNIRMGNTLNIKNIDHSGKKLICGIAHQFEGDTYFQHLTLSNYQYA